LPSTLITPRAITWGPRTRKSRNLVGNPRGVISVATHPFDLVVDAAELQSVDE
jgi:hypothetical protein